jgi:hypothetical protein
LRVRVALIVALGLTAGTAAGASRAPDTLVLCPLELHDTLAPWLAHRERQGRAIALVEPAATVGQVKRQIHQAAARESLRFIVLVGDVPTPLVPAQVNVHWGSEPDIASDAPYADLDEDGVPDVAIGRMPVQSRRELATVVTKILQYETAAGHDVWRRRVSIIAGLGGFGPAADAALEVTTRALVCQGVPAGYQTHLTYASWQSPYCPPPAKFRDQAISELNAGCLFWVYLGHGQRTQLDDVYVPGGNYPILSTSDAPFFRSAGLDRANPIALLVACYSGAFEGAEDCLAEAMLTSAEGPVAVLAASRVTLPYGNAVLCSELMAECFTHRRSTLGEMLLHAKRQLCSERPDDPCRSALDLLARLFSPVPATLAVERREHALLYNLLGDPLLSIAHGQDVRLDVQTSARAGESVVLRGMSPVAGTCTLELVSDRGQLTFTPPSRDRYDASLAAEAEFADTYRRANDHRYAAVTLSVPQGAFTTELHVPESARGACYVRAFIAGQTEHAVGAARVLVERASGR